MTYFIIITQFTEVVKCYDYIYICNSPSYDASLPEYIIPDLKHVKGFLSRETQDSYLRATSKNR